MACRKAPSPQRKRIIDRTRFTRLWLCDTKQQAQKKAKSLRKMEYKTRVISEGKYTLLPTYALWVNL